LWLGLTAASLATAAEMLQLRYPRVLNQQGQLIVPVSDSLFVMGQVAPEIERLWLNDQPVELRVGGRWLHWLARPDSLRFSLTHGATRIQRVYPLGHADPLAVTPLPPAEQIRIKRSGCSIKTAPAGTYYAFPQPGTRFRVIDTETNLYHVGFGNRREGWIRSAFAAASKSPPPAPGVIHRLLLSETEQGVCLELIAPQQTVIERLSPDRRRLQLTFTNAISDIDRIRYPAQLAGLLQVTWEQLGDREVRLTLDLLEECCYGWRLNWAEGVCRVDLRLESRQATGGLRWLRPGKGWTVVLDPGHGGEETGAIGPGGLMEKDVNLRLARRLRTRLERKGFKVLLTREADTTLTLTDRVAIAQAADADLFVSLHFNSVAPDRDPRQAGGTSLLWYYPQAAPLAIRLHSELTRRLQLGDDGLYYGNLAVLRNSWLPAVLVEGGYLIRPETEAALADGPLLEREAKALCRGIVRYIKGL